MEILLGLVAAVGWGAGDFFARYATQRIGTYSTLFYMQFVGLIGLGLYLFTTGKIQALLTSTSWIPWAWAFVTVVVNVISSLALYRAFEVGTLTLVSPIAASYAAITVIFAFLNGEVLTPLHTVAIGLVLLGVIVASTSLANMPARPEVAESSSLSTHTVNVETISVSANSKAIGTMCVPANSEIIETLVVSATSEGAKTNTMPSHLSLADTIKRRLPPLHGVGWALMASVGYGITFWLLGFHVTPALGGITPVWLVRLLTPCLLALCAPLTRQPLTWPRGNVWWMLIGVSVFDTIAYLAYASGLTLGHVSIVTMLSSLYSAVTVLLAWIVLHEHLQRSQWLGIGIIFIGIALISL